MVAQGVMTRFQDMKTQSKLMVSFGVVSLIIMLMASVGVFTLRQLSSQSQTVYNDYTVPLAEFADLLRRLVEIRDTVRGFAASAAAS